MKVGLLVLFMIFSTFAFTQTSDFERIASNELSKPHMHYHKVKFGITNSDNIIVKYNPITLALSGLMYTYQKLLSPQISANCYYEPTCSAYGKLMFQELGLVRGTMATADRILRCDRISATTFHPITVDPLDRKIHETANRYRFKEVHAHD